MSADNKLARFAERNAKSALLWEALSDAASLTNCEGLIDGSVCVDVNDEERELDCMETTHSFDNWCLRCLALEVCR